MVRLKEKSSGVERGAKFGNRTVLGVPFSAGTRWDYQVVVRCSCGDVSVVLCQWLSKGESDNCLGCAAKLRRLVHGETNTRMHRIWRGMKARCFCKRATGYPRYGGRGISVCDEWAASYESFRDWALANGYRDDLQCDRIDNDGGYSPENCRWVTSAVNNRNTSATRMLTAFGVTKGKADWLEDERCLVCSNTIDNRLKAGWSEHDAIAVPPLMKRKKQTTQ